MGCHHRRELPAQLRDLLITGELLRLGLVTDVGGCVCAASQLAVASGQDRRGLFWREQSGQAEKVAVVLGQLTIVVGGEDRAATVQDVRELGFGLEGLVAKPRRLRLRHLDVE